jgi:phospholipid/cholesterol/gamma-HCH transport system substrate-binding protein
MEERDKKTELLVGLFLFFGLLLLGLLVLQFGSVKELFKGTYLITVSFPDGTGIKDGTPVMLGGSKIGKVTGKPMLNATFTGVVIPLDIYHTAKIPADAKFSIGTAGLLGDSYIEIRPTGVDTGKYLEPNAAVVGSPASGLSGLQDTAKDLSKKVDVALVDIQLAITDLRTTLGKINNGVLSDQNVGEIKSIISHFNQTVTRLDERTFNEETSNHVKAAVASFKNAAKSLEDTAGKLEPTFAKIDKAADKAEGVMTSADSAMKSIDESAAAIGKVANDLRKGNGLLPALMYDDSLKTEFKQLISNLRQRGVLFYKDKTVEEAPTPPLRSSGQKR